MDQFFHPSKRLYWHVLSHQFHQRFKSRHRLHLYQVAMLTLIIFVLAFLISRSLPQPIQVLGESTIIPSNEMLIPSPIPTTFAILPPTLAPKIDTKMNMYYIALSPKPVATMSGLLADELVLALGLPLFINQSFPIQALAIDSLGATPSSTFNGRYVAVIDSLINTTRVYESPSAIVSLQTAPSSLLPYVLNKTFCVSNSDCLRRESACIEGAYNRYEPFVDNAFCLTHVQIADTSPTTCSITPTCISNQCQLINSCNP